MLLPRDVGGCYAMENFTLALAPVSVRAVNSHFPGCRCQAFVSKGWILTDNLVDYLVPMSVKDQFLL